MRWLLVALLAAAGCGSSQEPAPEPVVLPAEDVPIADEPAEPAPVAGGCTADTDCRKEDNYCGGCHCLALGPGETAPACDDPVQCFAQPCGVTAGEPACVDGRCVLQ